MLVITEYNVGAVSTRRLHEQLDGIAFLHAGPPLDTLQLTELAEEGVIVLEELDRRSDGLSSHTATTQPLVITLLYVYTAGDARRMSMPELVRGMAGTAYDARMPVVNAADALEQQSFLTQHALLKTEHTRRLA